MNNYNKLQKYLENSGNATVIFCVSKNLSKILEKWYNKDKGAKRWKRSGMGAGT